MNDRELLELAAKAAGRSVKWDGNVAVLLDFEPGVDDCSAWYPLEDDGDALRLAVKLRLNVACPGVVRDEGGRLTLCDETSEPDDYAATRRAIVVAAAEIGRTK